MTRRDPRRSPLWKPTVDREVREEMEFHLEMLMRRYRDRGLDPVEARRRALETFGDPDRHGSACRELARGRDRGRALRRIAGEVLFDLRFALRQLVRRRGFFATLLLVLTLGIGSSIAVFALVRASLLAPPPFAQPDRLVTLWESQSQRGADRNVIGPANFLRWRERATSFETMAGFATTPANLTGDGSPRRVMRRLVTDGYFELLGVDPLLGRTLQPADALNGADDVAVLSHGLWTDRFGADPEVTGRTFDLDGRSTTVVGVMPPRFALDMGDVGAQLGRGADLWIPLPVSERWRTAGGRWLLAVARLADGVTPRQAGEEMKTLAAALAEESPQLNAGWSAEVVELQRYLTSSARAPLWTLFGAVLLILLLVCVNAASLLASRSAARSREIAVRSALGAGRRRLVRQMLVEAAVLAVLAGGAGLACAGALLRVLQTRLPRELLTGGELTVDAPVAIFALLVTTATVALLGLVPGLSLRRGAAALLRGGGLGGSSSQRRMRSGLVFVEVVTAVVLVFGAGLMLRTLNGLLDIDPGFDRSRTVAFSATLSGGRQADEVLAFHRRVIEGLESQPGVEAAGAVNYVPLSGGGAGTSYFALDRPEPAPGERSSASIFVVAGDYLAAMGIPLLEGRAFDGREQADAAPAEVAELRSPDTAGTAEADGMPETEAGPRPPGSVLVNRVLAEELWPGRSAVGRRLSVFWGEAGPREVVGVVGDIRDRALNEEPRAAIYFPVGQEPTGALTFVARTTGRPDGVLAAASRIVAEVDPEVPIFDRRNLGELIRSSTARERLLARVLGAFAALALLLACLGIYGVTSSSVLARTREIGIRLALGAGRGALLREVFGASVLLVLAATLTGIAVAVAVARAAGSLLHGVEPTDPWSLAATAAALLACALVALALPARRATRLPPTEALRPD